MEGSLTGIAPRQLTAGLAQRLTEEPAIVLNGPRVESFAVGEIIRQATWSDTPVAAGHFRTAEAQEVDLVLERDDGTVFGFQIKEGTRVDQSDLAGFRAPRARAGHRLAAAVVLYTGAHTFRFDDATWVLPLDALWSATAGQLR